MFYNYKIVNDNLYLYLTLNYEFSKELDYINDSKLDKLTIDFINTNNINFKGKNIYYVVDNIIVKKKELKKYEIDKSFNVDNFLINIKLDDNSICEITLKEYLYSILFNIYSNNFSIETLKSVLVLFTTYAYKCMSESNYLDGNSAFINFLPLEYYKDMYKNYDTIIKYFNKVINDVDCNYISYKGKYILPFIHYCNDGYTIKNPKYEYLSSVKSLWDITSDKYINTIKYNYSEISKLLKIGISVNSKVKINDKSISIDDHKYTINEFIDCLNIPSNKFIIILDSDYFIISYKGYGISYGLSLFGADFLAKNGYNYINILNYYFPNTRIFKHIKKLS